jgi:hypothetical protein
LAVIATVEKKKEEEMKKQGGKIREDRKIDREIER